MQYQKLTSTLSKQQRVCQQIPLDGTRQDNWEQKPKTITGVVAVLGCISGTEKQPRANQPRFDFICTTFSNFQTSLVHHFFHPSSNLAKCLIQLPACQL